MMTTGLLFTVPELFGALVSWRRAWPVWVATAVAVGVGWISRRLRRPDVTLGFAGAACAVGALVHAQLLHERFGASPFGDEWAWRLIASGPLILWTSAAVFAARDQRFLPVAAGLALFAGPVDGLAVSAALMGMHLVVDHRAPTTTSERLSLFAVSALAALCVLGITEDAAATVAPHMDQLMRRWYPDDPSERVVRATAELATVLGVVGFVRGRTWGALSLVPAGVALAACAMSFRGLVWGAGCLGHVHMLRDGAVSILGLLTVALLPWLVPVGRALLGVVRGTA